MLIAQSTSGNRSVPRIRPVAPFRRRNVAGQNKNPRASMARPFSRGKTLNSLPPNSLPPLQWGRDLSVAESVARSRAISRRATCSSSASMGPRPFSRGKRRKHKLLARDSARASMGPRPFSRGKRESHAAGVTRRPASMGPRPFSRGKPGSASRFGAMPQDAFCERCHVGQPNHGHGRVALLPLIQECQDLRPASSSRDFAATEPLATFIAS